jgi:hypothetical protein
MKQIVFFVNNTGAIERIFFLPPSKNINSARPLRGGSIFG